MFQTLIGTIRTPEIRSLVSKGTADALRRRIGEVIAHLLKHDWERSKREAAVFRLRPYHVIFLYVACLAGHLIAFLLGKLTDVEPCTSLSSADGSSSSVILW